MADQYTQITRTSFFGNMLNSVVGVLLGLGLFLGSFFVLWINEGRINLATVAQRSVPIAAATIDPSGEGKLVAASGTLATQEQLGDAGYVRPGRYLALERAVEMYAWVEHRHSTTRKNAGGSSTTETTYSYTREWTYDPESASSFHHQSGHENPSLPLESRTWKVGSARLDVYTVDPQALMLPKGQTLALDEISTPSGPWRVSQQYLVNRAEALSSPRVGDVRIHYVAVPNKLAVTLFGLARGSQIGPYETKGAQLYRAFTENREQAIQTLNTEYTTMLWLLRLLGFVMMWIGMCMGFGPINAALDVLPLLGNLSRFLIGVVMFGVALALSVLTIIASIIAHNIFLLLGVLVLAIGGGVLWSRSRRAPSAAVPA